MFFVQTQREQNHRGIFTSPLVIDSTNAFRTWINDARTAWLAWILDKVGHSDNACKDDDYLTVATQRYVGAGYERKRRPSAGGFLLGTRLRGSEVEGWLQAKYLPY